MTRDEIVTHFQLLTVSIVRWEQIRVGHSELVSESTHQSRSPEMHVRNVADMSFRTCFGIRTSEPVPKDARPRCASKMLKQVQHDALSTFTFSPCGIVFPKSTQDYTPNRPLCQAGKVANHSQPECRPSHLL